MSMSCTVCQKRSYSEYCFKHKPRKPLNKGAKSIKQKGKHAKKWDKVRAQWFSDNPADNYTCYLCNKWLTPQETVLDHVIPKSRAPQLRYEYSNLKPCCWICNGEKGSKVY